MGLATHQLVYAAALLDHPQGLSKNAYIALMDQAHVSEYTRFEKGDPMSSYTSGAGDLCRGSKGLALALRLDHSRQYDEFYRPVLDSRGLVVCSPSYFCYSDQREKETLKVTSHHVVEYLQNVPRIIDKPAIETETLEDIWRNFSGSYEIEKLVVEELRRLRSGEKSSLEEAFAVPYTFRGKWFYALFRIETYMTEEEVWQRWPQFHPDFVYDFAQEKGVFAVAMGGNNFLWRQEGGRYFLDPETFNRIPASLRASGEGKHSWGYTDLVITAEAMRHGAWKLLSRRGFDHIPEFLQEFPDSRERLEEAIRDSHTFLAGKEWRENHQSRPLTVEELLRLRLTPWEYQRQGKEVE